MYSASSATHAAALRRPLTVALTALLLAAGAPVQAGPAISGPSTARVAQNTVFSGAGFAPNTPLTVAVAAPGQVNAHFSAVAGADGNLSYTLIPHTAGRYSLKVIDGSGKVLTSTSVHAIP